MNPLQTLDERLSRLETSFNSNLSTVFRNQQELKHGLDSAEVNQRAMVKVASDLFKTTLGTLKPLEEGMAYGLPVVMKGLDIDWGAYYRMAEDDVAAERLAAYKADVAERNVKADQIEKDLPEFEAGLDKELEEAGVTDENSPRAKAVLRFLNELKKEIKKIRDAADILARDALDKEKVEEFNSRILSDALFMIARQKAKKSPKTENTSPLVTPEEDNTVTTEFGG